MANEEQLAILKKGARVWNKWRWERADVAINLQGANLRVADLRQADLRKADLAEADLDGALLNDTALDGANLAGTILNRAHLSRAILSEACLSQAKCAGTNLDKAHLRNADLSGAYLLGANLSLADLRYANLSLANLFAANLSGAIFKETNFWKTKMGGTIFGNSDLSDVIGLENVDHGGPSVIGLHTIQLSTARMPEIFLRGCGLSDWEIEGVKLYNPDLSNDEVNKILYRIYDLRATQALQISPLFISYSHGDGGFVDKIGQSLAKKGVRYWRDVHDATAGRLEKQIDRAIRQNPTVLLVLSEHSFKSDWVEYEVRTARDLEKEMVRDVLCPVALDDSWKSRPWPKRVMEQIMEYNILDFSNWKDDTQFGDMFRRLIDGLELFYKA